MNAMRVHRGARGETGAIPQPAKPPFHSEGSGEDGDQLAMTGGANVVDSGGERPDITSE